MGLFDDEFGYREVANWQDLTNLAVALLIGMAGGSAMASSSGGGGSSTDNNWGRDRDGDDLRWARRCAKAAAQKLGRQNTNRDYADKLKNNKKKVTHGKDKSKSTSVEYQG